MAKQFLSGKLTGKGAQKEIDGVKLDEDGLVQRVLARFREVRVDLVDVYLAEKSRSLGISVLTWNAKDFWKAGI